MPRFFKRMLGRKTTASPIRRDQKLMGIVDGVIDACEYVIAIGEGAAETAIFLGERNPTVECLACEPQSETYFEAAERATGLKNVYLFNAAPKFFLRMIDKDKPYLFGRDVLVVDSAAGGGADRDMKWEIEFIAGRFQAAFLLLTGLGPSAGDSGPAGGGTGDGFSIKALAPCFAGVEYASYHPRFAARGASRVKEPEWRLVALGRNHDFDFSDDAKACLAKD